MDGITEKLVDYALGYSLEAAGENAVRATLHHLIDSVAVAIAGTTAESSRAAADVATAWPAAGGATVIGRSEKAPPDLAAFANAVMVRTYDWNDGMQASAGGHPSDMIPGLLAVAEVCHSSGAELMNATALAYELLGGVGIVLERGVWDQGLFMGGSTALACGRLLRLTREQLGQAASLAYTTALPLSVHRWGELSMMKGASTAYAVRNGVFCALLAQRGFTSAPEPMEGFYGMTHVMGEFDPRLPVVPGGPSVIEMSHQKLYPAETQVLGLLDLVPKVRDWAGDEEIVRIDVEMSERAVRHVADPAKYDPKNRETADHSLPYMLTVALLDGEITLESYADERVHDPALRPLMRRIVVHPNEEFTRIRQVFDGVTRAQPVKICFRTASGREFNEELRYHRGHFRSPLTSAEIDHKLDSASHGVLDDATRDRIRGEWWGLGSATDVASLMRSLGSFGPR
ncbi:MmgE/PrpD family protein [Nocardioides halotolerans]|uniref:MmgE/PrpD family protein n=1 Tax=Nocardioides halotolerans TaxID=433660 RepID=UPI0004277FA6|nr:MmgE/PrpD family protein [Nocardioides halotolerans]